eukprot:PhM_4_TR13902/c0_g1_i1/m.96115
MTLALPAIFSQSSWIASTTCTVALMGTVRIIYRGMGVSGLTRTRLAMDVVSIGGVVMTWLIRGDVDDAVICTRTPGILRSRVLPVKATSSRNSPPTIRMEFERGAADTTEDVWVMFALNTFTPVKALPTPLQVRRSRVSNVPSSCESPRQWAPEASTLRRSRGYRRPVWSIGVAVHAGSLVMFVTRTTLLGEHTVTVDDAKLSGASSVAPVTRVANRHEYASLSVDSLQSRMILAFPNESNWAVAGVMMGAGEQLWGTTAKEHAVPYVLHRRAMSFCCVVGFTRYSCTSTYIFRPCAAYSGAGVPHESEVLGRFHDHDVATRETTRTSL